MPGNGHALLLAAGKRIRTLKGKIRDTHLFQAFKGGFLFRFGQRPEQAHDVTNRSGIEPQPTDHDIFKNGKTPTRWNC